MNKVFNRVGCGYRLCVLGDMIGWIVDKVRVRAGITGAFGVLRENDNERRVVEFCAKRVGYVWVTHTLSTSV